MNLMDVNVPMAHVCETHIYDAPRRVGVGDRYSIIINPVYTIRIHDQLDFQGGSEIRLKLFQLYVHSAGGLSGRPWWKRHFELPFSWGWGVWPGQDWIF